jgi:hypothetical protein
MNFNEAFFYLMKKRKMVLICGREHLSEDKMFNARLVAYLYSLDVEIVHETAVHFEQSNKSAIVLLLKRLYVYGILRAILHGFRTQFDRYYSKASVIMRVQHLKESLSKIDWKSVDLFIVSRSAGAIVASELALEFPIKAVIALGYPFIHPEYGMQKYRVRHLANVNRPLYIFQGTRDEYGTPAEVAHIPMSEYIQLIPLATDHAFVLDEACWEEFTSQLAQIIS